MTYHLQDKVCATRIMVKILLIPDWSRISMFSFTVPFFVTLTQHLSVKRQESDNIDQGLIIIESFILSHILHYIFISYAQRILCLIFDKFL